MGFGIAGTGHTTTIHSGSAAGRTLDEVFKSTLPQRLAWNIELSQGPLRGKLADPVQTARTTRIAASVADRIQTTMDKNLKNAKTAGEVSLHSRSHALVGIVVATGADKEIAGISAEITVRAKNGTGNWQYQQYFNAEGKSISAPTKRFWPKEAE